MNKIYLKIKRKFKMYIVACDGPSRYKLCLDAIHNVNSIRRCSRYSQIEKFIILAGVKWALIHMMNAHARVHTHIRNVIHLQ